jgi:hypothetical protein
MYNRKERKAIKEEIPSPFIPLLLTPLSQYDIVFSVRLTAEYYIAQL